MAFPNPIRPTLRAMTGRMPYRRTGRSGLKLPAISLGLWQNFGGTDVFETGRAILRRAFDGASPISTLRTITARPSVRRKRISGG